MARPVAKAKAKRVIERDVKLTCVGMQYRIKKDARRMMKKHVPFRVAIRREPSNEADENAMAVFVAAPIPYKGLKLGYLVREVAAVWSPLVAKKALRIPKAEVIGLNTDKGEAELLVTVRSSQKDLEAGLNYKQRKRLDKFV